MTVDGRPINHSGPGYGDPYAYPTLANWDHDGKPDVLYGTHQGNVYLHRGIGEASAHTFAPGELLSLNT